MNFMFINNSDVISDVKSTSWNKSKIKQVNRKRFKKFHKHSRLNPTNNTYQILFLK